MNTVISIMKIPAVFQLFPKKDPTIIEMMKANNGPRLWLSRIYPNIIRETNQKNIFCHVIFEKKAELNAIIPTNPKYIAAWFGFRV